MQQLEKQHTVVGGAIPPTTVSTSQTIQTTVFCTVQIEGTHRWEKCPFDDVAFLRHQHRHMFHIKAHKPVTHSDRDVEFILLKRKIITYLTTRYSNLNENCLDFGKNSCEMIARELVLEFNLSQCEVNEDGENGAIVTVVTTR